MTPGVASAQPQDPLPTPGYRWVGSWGASPSYPFNSPATPVFSDNTVRVIAHLSLGTNNVVRVRLSNAQSTGPITFSDVHIAVWGGSASSQISTIVPATDRSLTFGGASSVTVPAGAEVISDYLYYPVPAETDVAVSIYVPTNTVQSTLHFLADSTTYVASGDVSGSATLSNPTTYATGPFLTGIDVGATTNAFAIVAFGDSITDGAYVPNNANLRWPDDLGVRLQAAYGNQLGIVNAGIGGNYVLKDADMTVLGSQGAIHRMDRDVLAVPGLKYVIFYEGINDIAVTSGITAAQVIAGYQTVIARAHERGLYIYAGTVTPFGAASTDSREVVRQAVNTFIRTSGAFDGVIDFDKVIADPSNPGSVLPAYNSDGVHPNLAGYQAMANIIDLHLFDPSTH